MRRLILVFCVLLAGCGRSDAGVPKLPPEEVLERAARASQSLESARYVVSGNFVIQGKREWKAEGEGRIEGILTDGGDQVQFQFDLEADVSESTNAFSLDGTIEVIVTLEDEIYLYLHALSVQPSGNLFRPDLIGKFANRWWVLPKSPDADADPMGIAPDPKLLSAQSQVVAVTEDRGVDTINGREAYRYSVSIDQEKLLRYLAAVAEERGEKFDADDARERIQDIGATGEIWIDAEEFWVHRIVWDVTVPFEESAGTFKFTATLRDHNAAPAIVVPENAEAFSPLLFLGSPLPVNGSRAKDPLLPTSSPEMQESIIDQIIRDMRAE